MNVILDFCSPNPEDDDGSSATLSETASTYLPHQDLTSKDLSDAYESTNEEKISPLKRYHAWYPSPSQTPIYDYEMRAAGKEPGSEEKILRQGPPRRYFGRQKRLLEIFISAAEELREDIDRAWTLTLDEELCGAIEYFRVLDERKESGEDEDWIEVDNICLSVYGGENRQ